MSKIALDRIPGYVVAVNDAAKYLPRCDAIVSMDRLWTENRADLLITALEAGRRVFLRKNTAPQRLIDAGATMYECNHSLVHFGPTFSHMNGTNSGVVALNVAYVMWPRELQLYGFDMQRGPKDEAHWYPDYPWNKKASSGGKLMEWGKQFETIANQFARKRIDVTNVSSRSLVKTFKTKTPREMGVEA